MVSPALSSVSLLLSMASAKRKDSQPLSATSTTLGSDSASSASLSACPEDECLTSATNSPSSPVPSNASYYLEYRSHALLRLINARAWSAVEQFYPFAAPDFTGKFMHAPLDHGYKEHLATFKRALTLMPGLHIDILETNVHVNEEAGTAELFMLTQGRGGIPGIKINGMSSLRCRKDATGQWVAYEHVLSPGLVDVV